MCMTWRGVRSASQTFWQDPLSHCPPAQICISLLVIFPHQCPSALCGGHSAQPVKVAVLVCFPLEPSFFYLCSQWCFCATSMSPDIFWIHSFWILPWCLWSIWHSVSGLLPKIQDNTVSSAGDGQMSGCKVFGPNRRFSVYFSPSPSVFLCLCHLKYSLEFLNQWYGLLSSWWIVSLEYLEDSIYGSREGNGTPLQYSCLENPMDGGAWWAAVHGVTKSRTRLSDFTFTFHFHALEKEMATHSSVLAWRIPGTGEPGGLPSMVEKS